MMSPRERAASDPHFNMLVHFFYDAFDRHCSSGAGFTPSEIREASGYAWQLYAERHQPITLLMQAVPADQEIQR